MTDSINVRRPAPKLQIAGVVLLVASVALGAAANMIPFHVPTAREVQRAEQEHTALARRTRIELLATAWNATPQHCPIDSARVLARDLVLDGQSAVAFAEDFERRCGIDPVVQRWSRASHLLVAVTKKP